jgi:hypothetical protein
VTITATVKDAGNASIANAPVSFVTDSGQFVGQPTMTDANGQATATFSAGSNATNRTATITVTSGTVSKAIQVQITGTTLTLSGAGSVRIGDVVPLTVKVVDSKGKDVSTANSGATLKVSSSSGNTLSASTLSVAADGTATVTLTATTAGTDHVSVTGLGATAALDINVSAENFTFVSPSANAQVPVGLAGIPARVRYLVNGSPVVGVAVSFAATAGTLSPSTVSTDVNGEAVVTVSSNSASPAVIQATLAGGVAQATLPIEFIATTPSKLTLQVARTALGPNAAGSTSQRTDVIATVTDANGNPVKSKQVNFNRIADPSGGSLTLATSTTDSAGRAIVQYVAGPQTTANDGVQIRATVAGVSSIFGDATVTVNQSALFIGLGTSNEISNLDPTTYQKDYTVSVSDSNGNPVPNANLTIGVLPVEYLKGSLTFVDPVWTYAAGTVTCPNEDANYNGVLDVGEDADSSGTLQPGNVVRVSPGSVTTDANGQATVKLLYQESYAPWVRVQLRARAVVSGTESSNNVIFTVTGAAPDFTNKSVPPAGVVSPFGTHGCGVAN